VPEDYRTNVRKSRADLLLEVSFCMWVVLGAVLINAPHPSPLPLRGEGESRGSSEPRLKDGYYLFFFAAFLTFLTAFFTVFLTAFLAAFAFFLAAIPLNLLLLIRSRSPTHGLHAGLTSKRRAGAPQNPGSH
jgi:hypothetical protein